MVWEWWGAGPSWQVRNLGSSDYPTDAQAADMDSDGDMDIVVAELCTGQVGEIRWYKNNGA